MSWMFPEQPPQRPQSRSAGVGAAEVLLAVAPALALIAPALFVTCKEMLRAALVSLAAMLSAPAEPESADRLEEGVLAPISVGFVGDGDGPQDFHSRLWGLPVVVSPPHSGAWAGRLCEGDVIVEVDFHGAPSPAGLERALEGARSVEIVPARDVREGVSQAVYAADPRRCRIG
ncbi:MAG: hypothetical protein K2P95_06305 [Hyphomonadaceae bacterium]|nr:hypothetical protein [Hyphomonadaceae bacterium]